jgi:hypothetical protein
LELPEVILEFPLAVCLVGGFCVFLKQCGLWNCTITESRHVIGYNKKVVVLMVTADCSHCIVTAEVPFADCIHELIAAEIPFADCIHELVTAEIPFADCSHGLVKTQLSFAD